MEAHQYTSGIILAGGLSRRMGQDKRRLHLWGKQGPTLLAHTTALIASVCDEVIVVLNDPEAWPDLSARLVPDMYPDGGSLGGIYTGLTTASHNDALTVACDMPFLNTELLAAMLAYPRRYDVLVPRSLEPGTARNDLQVEPLHAIYSKSCLAPMRAMLESGQRQIARLFPQIHMITLEPDEIRHYDPAGRSFFNVNTPEQAHDAQA